MLSFLLYACLIALLSARIYRPWMSWATSAVDTSTVTLVLGGFVALGMPLMASNSRTVFELYFLTIILAGFRSDSRVPVGCGILAAVGYCLVCMQALRVREALLFDVTEARYYGEFIWGGIALRMTWLVVAGAVMGIVVQQARRMRQLTELDSLTGLAERLPFVERASAEIQQASRDTGLTLAVVDVDGFRTFAQAAGEASAERATQSLGRALKGALRRGDFAARYGGQQFLVAMVGLGPEEATGEGERLRVDLGNVGVGGAGDVTQLTVCIGLACWPFDGETFEEVLARADARLFIAKEEGPDRVVGPPLPTSASVTELVKR